MSRVPAPAAAAAAASSSASTASAVASPSAASVSTLPHSSVAAGPTTFVLLHASELRWDACSVTVTEDDSRLLHMPFQLLVANRQLLQPLLKPFKQRAAGVGLPSFEVGEIGLVLLHLLITLHSLALRQPSSPIEVILMSRLALLAAAKGKSSAPTRTPSQHLVFPASTGATTSFRMRWSDTWVDATSSRAPVRCVFLPSLMWLQDFGDHAARKQQLAALLSPLRAHLWPPLSWDELLEQKDHVYSVFNEFMLPTTWISYAAVGSDLQRLATLLLRASRHQGGNGTFVVKGSLSFGAQAVKRIDIKNYQCPELLVVLRDIIEVQFQHCIGIQVFVPSFEHYELRTWVVLDDVTHRWRAALTIRTQDLQRDGEVTQGQLYQPLHGTGLRVAQLVDDMLEKRADFFEQLRLQGVPAVRIDCGYCEQRRRAFFNEFATGDAHMWTQTHLQDLAFVIGRSYGKRVFELLRSAPAE